MVKIINGMQVCWSGRRLKMNKYNIGDIVEHKLSKDWLMILKLCKEQVLCRTKDLREIWVYGFEIDNR